MPKTSNKQDADASARGVEWYRSALADAEAEIQTKNKTIAELQRNTHHHVARIAQLTEENEELRKERDDYKQQLEEATEKPETELREVMEEMAAAARFSEKEWRERCDRLEATCAQLQTTVDVCLPATAEYLPHAETGTRRRLEEKEDARRKALVLSAYHRVVASTPLKKGRLTNKVKRAFGDTQLYFLCCVLDCTREELQAKFLGKEVRKTRRLHVDTSARTHGLWELYLTLCDVGFPTDAAMTNLLERDNVDRLSFNAIGHEQDFFSDNCAIPPTAAYDFFHRLLRHLPNLRELHLSHLPPLSSPEAVEALADTPRTLHELYLYHTHYTVADLRALHERCPGVRSLNVHVSHCTDWGEFANIDDMWQRRRQVSEACGITIYSVEM